MRIVDLNVLLYVVNESSSHHTTARRWWEEAIEAEEGIGLTWPVVLGFLRLSVNPVVFPRPLQVEEAIERINAWLSLDGIRLVTESEGHWEILRSFLVESGAAGNLTTDAHMAALAIGCGATLVSFDNDFSRFRGLRWEKPE